MKIDGSCHCGAIRYEAEVAPDGVTICHCRDCQKLTGSAFRLTVAANEEDFRLKADPPQDLRQDRRERRETRASLLRRLRLADLCDLGRRWPEGLRAAGRHHTPAARTSACPASVAALGAQLGARDGRSRNP